MVAFLVIQRGFLGLSLSPFWSAVLMATALGLVTHWAFVSVAGLDTRRMSSLLLLFVVLGTFASMVTAPDPQWWHIHFSHLGTFWHISGVLFNGTLIAAGILISTFAIYIASDLRQSLADGRLERPLVARVFPELVVALGIALAGVGLVLGPWLLKGLPPTYFVASGGFFLGTIVTVALTTTGFFGITALEIIVFALIFGWFAVFIGFLEGAAIPDDGRGVRTLMDRAGDRAVEPGPVAVGKSDLTTGEVTER